MILSGCILIFELPVAVHVVFSLVKLILLTWHYLYCRTVDGPRYRKQTEWPVKLQTDSGPSRGDRRVPYTSSVNNILGPWINIIWGPTLNKKFNI